MRTRALGKTDVKIVPLMLGGNVFGWTADRKQSFAVLDAFVDGGGNFIDTADVYSVWAPGHVGGESETIIGEWLKRSGKRDKVVLATKVGFDMGAGRQGLSRRYILEEAEASLGRLGTDHIDLYQSHTDDQTTPLEETLGAYQTLIEQGKVRLIGASNYLWPRLREAMEVAKKNGLPAYATVQPEYNLYARVGFETELRPVAEQFGLGVVTYASLANGFLTGKFKSKEETKGTKREKRLEKYFDARGMRILGALAEVAQETGAAEASVGLAWIMAQPTITAPIASATSAEQVRDLLAAVELELTAEQVGRLTEASAW